MADTDGTVRVVVRRDGSVHQGIFRIGSVRQTWPLHFPGTCWESSDKDGNHIDYRLRRKDAVSAVVDAWNTSTGGTLSDRLGQRATRP